MKILYVITKGNWGGAQRYVYDLATGLPKNQFNVTVVVGQGETLPEKLAAAGIATQRLSSLDRNLNPLADFQTGLELFRIFRRERPDVVHLNSPKAGGLGALAARLAGVKKIIYTAHGWTFNEARPWPTRALIWLFSWLTVSLAHETVTITVSEQLQGLRFPGTKKKIKLIRNGLAAPSFLSREQAREKLFIANDKILIGTIAELHRNKGLEYLIQALEKIRNKNWQAVIIGGGEDKINLENLIAARGLETRIKLAGFQAEAPALLLALDIFVLPSLKEGLPYAILEAGLAGLPVVATRVGGIPEIITSEHSGLLIPPRDSDALTAALCLLLDSTPRRHELGQNLKQQVATHYSLPLMIKQFTDLYQLGYNKPA